MTRSAPETGTNRISGRSSHHNHNLSFHGECWPLVFLTCFAAFLSETYIPSVSECLGPGMDSVPFHLSLSFLCVSFLSSSFCRFFICFHFYFFLPLSPSALLLFFFFFFVKPSSFKIIKWWFFGWGNNTFFKKYLYQEAIFYFRNYKTPLFKVMKV